MSEKVTPSVSHFRDVYGYMLADWCRDNELAQFDRMIAKVKADALREAAEDMDNTDDPDAIHIANGDADLWLDDRADRIEGEAMGDEQDGRVITGATIRTSAGLPRREINDQGMFHIDRQGGKWKYVGSIYDQEQEPRP